MRTRLLAVMTSLVVLVVVGLGAPLALIVAGSEGQQLFLDRLTDTETFAAQAQESLSSNDSNDSTNFNALSTELARYQDVYGIPAVVVDANGTVKAHSQTVIDVRDPAVHDAVEAALAGRAPQSGATLLPWNDSPLVVAEPVSLGGAQIGATVTVSTTNHARDVIVFWWSVLAGAAVVAIVLAVLAALPVVRWVLRPLGRLSEATAALTNAVVRGENVDPAGIRGGPSELRRLSESFDQLATTVTSTLDAQRKFVADASHQLRNPLTALRLRLGNLANHVAVDGETHQDAAVAECDRLGMILDDLLAMARAESGAVASVEVDVDQVVTQRVATWQVLADRRNVSMVLAGEPGGTALVQSGGLEKILDALLANALKFTGEGTLVEVEVRRDNGMVVVSVRDHGPGLEPEELARATDRFWRSKAHQNVPGTGLGLAIVLATAQRAAGDVDVSIPDGGGLMVKVRLPAAETEQ